MSDADAVYEDAHGNRATVFVSERCDGCGALSPKHRPARVQIDTSSGSAQLDARDLITLVEAVKRHLGVK